MAEDHKSKESGRSIEAEIMGNETSLSSSFLGKSSELTGHIFMGMISILGMTILGWWIEVVDRFIDLSKLGIHPRELRGLFGIFLSPWLHGSWGHLIGNTFAFWGLGFFMVFAEKDRFLRTTLWLAILSGLGTWLIAKGGSVHIGASGVIYGYIGYLLARSLTERRVIWVITGVVIFLAYGSYLWGVLPREEGVSWEAHACGCLAGIFLGRRHGKRNREERAQFL